jgi:type I restriction enzyme S subunit
MCSKNLDMKLNYKKIGHVIQEVDIRNTDLSVTNLIGVSMEKTFIPSVANIVGVDMSVYKVIKNRQFACKLMSVGRDEKLPVDLFLESENALVSSAYYVFEVKNEQEILSEYLLMWLSRPENDRYIGFISGSDVRGGISWETFCELPLHVPSIEKQKEIVAEYQVISKRINQLKDLIQKCDELLNAIYKEWFVDFEFPSRDLKSYKSNGGPMVEYEFGEMPKGWEYISIQTLIDREIIYKNQDGNHGEIHPKSSDFVESGVPFVMANDVNFGTVDLEGCSFISKSQTKKLRIGFSIAGDVLLTHKATMGRVAIVPEIDGYVVLSPQVTYFRVKDKSKISKEFIYALFNSYGFQTMFLGESEQSTRNYIGITNQRDIKIILPNAEIVTSFTKLAEKILLHKDIYLKELSVLKKISALLLSKLAKIN